MIYNILGVLKAVIDSCIEGAKVLELCQMGDDLIIEETKKVFKKEKEMKKGNIGKPFCKYSCNTL